MFDKFFFYSYNNFIFGGFMEKKVRSKTSIILDACCGILMLACIMAYVLIGIIAKVWHPTWIIVVAGAFVCAVIGIVKDTIANLKSADEAKKESSMEE